MSKSRENYCFKPPGSWGCLLPWLTPFMLTDTLTSLQQPPSFPCLTASLCNTSQVSASRLPVVFLNQLLPSPQRSPHKHQNSKVQGHSSSGIILNQNLSVFVSLLIKVKKKNKKPSYNPQQKSCSMPEIPFYLPPTCPSKKGLRVTPSRKLPWSFPFALFLSGLDSLR